MCCIDRLKSQPKADSRSIFMSGDLRPGADLHLSGKLVFFLPADVAGSTAQVQQNEQLAHQPVQETFRRFGSL